MFQLYVLFPFRAWTGREVGVLLPISDKTRAELAQLVETARDAAKRVGKETSIHTSARLPLALPTVSEIMCDPSSVEWVCIPEDEEAYFTTRRGAQEIVVDGEWVRMVYMPDPWTAVETAAADCDTVLELMKNLMAELVLRRNS